MRMYVCVCVRVCMCARGCVCVCVCVYVCVCMCVSRPIKEQVGLFCGSLVIYIGLKCQKRPIYIKRDPYTTYKEGRPIQEQVGL